jgi:hypothetical protein
MRDKEGGEKMIYNKNVEITVIFKREEDADEVMAVYQTVTMRDEEQCHDA